MFHQRYPALKGKPIKLVSPFHFDEEAVKRRAEELTPAGAKVTVLSNEIWTGHFFSGGITAKEYTQRIHTIFPNGKILIVIRRQEDMMLSAYADALERFYITIPLKSFLFVKRQDMAPAPNPYFFCFDGLVAYYAKLFGRDNVFVLPYEVLDDPDISFTDEVCRFAGVKPLPGESPAQNVRDYTKYAALKKLRALNLLFCDNESLDRPAVNIRGLRALRATMVRIMQSFISGPEAIREKDLALIGKQLEGYIRESNKNLQAFTDYDLKKLGYML